MSEEGDDAVASLQARKRRMERRAKQGHVSAAEEANASDSGAPACKKAKVMSKDVLAKIPGVKKQARYVPVVDGSKPVNMTKEELTLWRKEARRVRNRESAAASRQKTQGRISELEVQVATLTSKYQAALAHIAELEAMNGGSSSSVASVSSDSSQGSLAPASSASAWMPAKMSLDRAAAAALPTTVSPPLSPRDGCGSGSDSDSLPHQQPLHWSLDNPQDQDAISSSLSVPLVSSHHPHHFNSNVGSGSSSTSTIKYQQRPFKISRPNACVKNPFPRAVVTAI